MSSPEHLSTSRVGDADDEPAQVARAISRAHELRASGDWEGAAQAYGEAARGRAVPDADVCLNLARCYERLGDTGLAARWAALVVDAGESYRTWAAAAALTAGLNDVGEVARRTARVAVVGSYTTTQLAALVRLVALREGLWIDLHEGGYAQYESDLLDSSSALQSFDPDYVVIAVHEGALHLPAFSDAPEQAVSSELDRWQGLWERARDTAGARPIQHNFALRAEVAMGHLASRVPGSRYAMAHEINAQLGKRAGTEVSLVDCERLASWMGKERWFDDRYWHIAKQAVSFTALPRLARHTAAVLLACAGLTRRCLVVDLDNTLWGGVIGEDGLEDIELGAGPRGEAFVAFQEYLLELKRAGVLLAVVSKNDEADARLPFERHPDMRLSLDDFAVFMANWDDKPTNLRQLAARLDLGLDALVFVDDNPAECALVRDALPEVAVVPLPGDPSDFIGALAAYPMFETMTQTPEDHHRTELYRARAAASELQIASATIEDFYRALAMQAEIAPVDELHLPRVAQLVAKTNQFNITGRRHGEARLRSYMDDPEWVLLYLRLRDRFGDHGLVGAIIAHEDDGLLDIDSWVISCRVLGRTVETKMLERVSREAKQRDCTVLRGHFIPSGRNAVAADVFSRHDFRLADDTPGHDVWEYDLERHGAIVSPYIADRAPSDAHA